MGAKCGCLFTPKPGSEEYSAQAECQCQTEVDGKDSRMSATQQVDALARECREGCEAATETCGQEEPHLGRHACPTRQAIEKSDEKTAQHIGCHRRPGEDGLSQRTDGIQTEMRLDKFDAEAQDRSDTTSQKD